MSLKSNLNQLIKDRKGEIFTYKELEDYCKVACYKINNAERRLRPSDSPEIESVWDEKHKYIVGYRWKEIDRPLPKDWPLNTIKQTSQLILKF